MYWNHDDVSVLNASHPRSTRKNRELPNTVAKNDGFKSDRAAKDFLHRRSVLATIIKGLVDECRDMPRGRIEKCLGRGVYVKGLENDSYRIPGREDAVFEAIIPLPSGDMLILTINLEPQADGYALNSIFDRARDYSADLRIAQSLEHSAKQEGGPDKVKVRLRTMSIWILMYPPTGLRYTIHEFRREDHMIFGPESIRLEMPDDDLIVLVCLGDPNDADERLPEILEVLCWAMAKGIDNTVRVERLKGLGFDVNKRMEKELENMNSIQLDRENAARWEGRMEGKVEGKMEDASKLLAMGMPESQVIEVTGLTPEQLEEAKKLRARAPSALVRGPSSTIFRVITRRLFYRHLYEDPPEIRKWASRMFWKRSGPASRSWSTISTTGRGSQTSPSHRSSSPPKSWG